MGLKKHKWSNSDFSAAMENAVSRNASPKYLREQGDKILFNGFWRDGDKQNVCAWLNTATWADAKTGQGGGCKEFAEIAFDMTLPQFMEKFGRTTNYLEEIKSIKQFNSSKQNHRSKISVDNIWQELLKRNKTRTDLAANWLISKRGMPDPKKNIGSGFINLAQSDLELFDPMHHSIIQNRLLLGAQVVVPLRGVHSQEVKNLFFRAIDEVDSNEKTRLLSGAGGWSDNDNSPRAFGFPHLIHDFSNLVICEGMADYFAAECILQDNENYLPIGVANAQALTKWATWLSKERYKGNITVVYQIDPDKNGDISTNGTGQKNAIHALREFLNNDLHAKLFDWPTYLKKIDCKTYFVGDLADSLQVGNFQHLNDIFMEILTKVD